MKKSIYVVLFLLIAAVAGLLAWTKLNPEVEKNYTIYQEKVEDLTYDMDVCYQKTKKNNCNMDVAWKATGKKKPLIVVVHGGSWVSGSREMMEDYLHTLPMYGYTVANIDYDLINLTEVGTEDLMTIIKEEACVSAAVSYLVKHADEYEIDTEKIVLMGHSAGGQLVGNLTEKVSADPSAYDYSLKGTIILAGAVDFREYLYSEIVDSTLNAPLIAIAYIFDGKTENDIISEIDKVDLFTNVNENMPPILQVNGDYDELVPYPYAERLAKKLTEYGVENKLEIIHEMGHIISTQSALNRVIPYLQDLL